MYIRLGVGSVTTDDVVSKLVPDDKGQLSHEQRILRKI